MIESNLAGGSEGDHKRILEQHAAYLLANSRFDVDMLEGIWSASPEATFFNLNGHTYVGKNQWQRLWKFYVDKLETGEWVPYDMGGVVSGDVAVVWCHRKTTVRWIGSGPGPENLRLEDDYVSRSTMVFRREDDDWRVVHVHFSEASDASRPGGV